MHKGVVARIPEICAFKNIAQRLKSGLRLSLSKVRLPTMFYFLALNSGLVFAGNDISVLCFEFHSSDAYRSKHGTWDNLFDSYLQEYMWKKQHKDNIFGKILYCISFYYST